MLLKHSTFADGAQTANLLKTANPARMSSSCAHNDYPAFKSNMIVRGQHEEYNRFHALLKTNQLNQLTPLSLLGPKYL